MINLTLNQIKEKIVSEKQISEADIDSKIKKKLEELSGLISEEGAAHIVANELGVNLMKSEAGLIKIGSLIPGMKDVEIAGRVIRKYDVRTFQRETGEGKVGKILVGDDSGITMITLWNDKADWMENLNEQDIIKITNLNVRDNNGRSEAHAGEGSKLEKNPKGVEISSRQQQSTELVKKKISELTEQDSNAEIFVTIVQVFDPKFFEPRNEGEKAGAVLNLFVDDGSDNIRTVFWKEQIISLLNISEDKLLAFKDKLEAFEEIKSDLLGRMVKLIGRVSKNKVLGRLEFVVNKSITNIDPENLDEPQKTKEPNTTEQKQVETKDEFDELEEEVLSLDDLDDL